MAITTLAMVATVFVLNLYGMKEKPVPLWAKRVFIIYIARLLCICDCGATSRDSMRQPDAEASHSSRDTGHNKRHKYKKVTQQQAHSLIEVDDPIPLRGRGEGCRDHLVHYNHDLYGGHSAASSSRTSFLSPTSGDRRPSYKDEGGARKEDKKADYTKEWVHVAAVFDRLFFWLCLIFILITTLILFHPLTTAKYFNLSNKDMNADR